MFNYKISTILFTSFKLILIAPLAPAIALTWICYSLTPDADQAESSDDAGTQPRSNSTLTKTPQLVSDSFLAA